MEYGFPSAYGQTARSRSLPTDSDTHPQISRTAVSAILAIGPFAAPQTHRQTHEYRCPSTPLQVMPAARVHDRNCRLPRGPIGGIGRVVRRRRAG